MFISSRSREDTCKEHHFCGPYTFKREVLWFLLLSSLKSLPNFFQSLWAYKTHTAMLWFFQHLPFCCSPHYIQMLQFQTTITKIIINILVTKHTTYMVLRKINKSMWYHHHHHHYYTWTWHIPFFFTSSAPHMSL